MAWSALSPDALIAVVAPAGPALAGQVDQVQPLIEAQGWRARLYPSCRQARGYLAGSDEQRLADLHDAFADPEVKAVMCLRGGYGCGRLLERVNADLLSQHDKPLLGTATSPPCMPCAAAWVCGACMDPCSRLT